MEPKNHVVIMFEPALPGEKLKLSEQVNEVFGPFTETEAGEFAQRGHELIESREWLIIPLSVPSSLNAVDPLTN